ncbi:MAG: IS110 family transposase [Clostridia bacterium]
MQKNYLYVGIDVSLKTLVTCVIDSSGSTILKPKTFSNSPDGLDTLLTTIVSIASNFDTPCIMLGVEATSVYANHLLYSIVDSNILKDVECHSYQLNPKLVKKFKDAMGDLPKNDNSDSFVIASRIKMGSLPQECYINFKQLGLQRLTRYRLHLIQAIAREKTYMVSNLFLKFSTLAQEKVFSNNFGATAEALLTEFETTEDIASKPIDELISIVEVASKKRFNDIHETALAIQKAANSSFKLNQSLDISLSIVIKSCYANIDSLEKAVKHLDIAIKKEVETLFYNDNLILNSIGGIGPVISAGIISEIGDISRFRNDNALAKYSGLVWSQYQSGEYEAQDTKLRKTGNSYLRYYFCIAADCMRKNDDTFKKYYSGKFGEVKSHQHKRALVLTARKAIRLIFSLLQEKRLYIPSNERGDAYRK